MSSPSRPLPTKVTALTARHRQNMADEMDPPSSEAFSSVDSLIKKTYEILSTEAKRVREEREAFESVAKKLEHVHFNKMIELNVGGQHFTTSLETLRKDAASMLNAMFSGRFDVKPDKSGAYFIDRDGTHFRYILNYLRTGKLIVPEDITIRSELLAEAEFYQIQGIIDDLDPKFFTQSMILTDEQKDVLKSWVVEEFKHVPVLLFRASRDGWAASQFHARCDNKGPTVTIVKSGTYIFGGYADKPWNSSGGVFYSCTKSFLFSLVNPAGIGPTKMTLKSANAANGILCNKDYGPIFGAGHDLMISNASNTKNASQSKLDNTYECPPNQTNTTFLAGNQNFTISEYEIFG